MAMKNRGYKRVEYFDDGLQQLDKYRQGQFQEPDMVTESPYGPEVLVENDSSLVSRELSRDEAVGNNILLTLRTIQKYHNDRLPLLFDTWLSKVNKSNVFLMTDGKDSTWQRRVWNEGMLLFMDMSTCSMFGRCHTSYTILFRSDSAKI